MTKRNNAAKTPRGRPFEAGNPGRPVGARHKATLAAESLLDGEAEKLTRKAVEMALGGDTTAMRLCLERIVPPRRDRPIAFAVPEIATSADAVAVAALVLSAVAAGDMTPGDATAVMGVVDGYRRMLEVTEVELRMRALEKANTK